MAIYHIVLFKLRPGVRMSQVQDWAACGSAMLGQIPGLLQWHCGQPLAMTAYRARGYDMGIVAILENTESLQAYADHPAHQRVHEMREALCSETLAFDFET
ncbi:hypothetical protein N3K66_006290 [Trichothecium roseum]|uniref:Uncharacterized protein n=1 Tax=Trichothecium roseum TaxID=47278 RepID=A0ACC0UWQ4_9HYPO|nr:hypothetical protein N3K66_006290 [Trichothecium roseum]